LLLLLPRRRPLASLLAALVLHEGRLLGLPLWLLRALLHRLQWVG